MKLDILRNPYIVLVGAVVVIIAFAVYMWLDTRNLNRSRVSEAEPILQTESAVGDSGIIFDQPVTRDVPKTNSLSSTRETPEEKTPVQKELIDPEEQAKSAKEFFRKQDRSVAAVSPKTRSTSANTDDWMFAPGDDVEVEPVITDPKEMSTPE